MFLVTWKYDQDSRRLQDKSEREDEKFQRWLAEDEARFVASLQGKSPEEVTEAYRARGSGIAAAATCAAVAACCF
jgi:hypothetical protein